MMGLIARRVVVHGFVQGVGFRYSALEKARRLGVSGWVRNRGDGAVEALFEGERDDVEAMVRWCERGPRGAEVGEVEVLEEPLVGLSGFEIAY
jgi:acylphosphatase